MNYIKKLHIEGFKKFDKIDINFNEDKNIIIGENESGKSTILEAINIVLNQKYKNSDKSFLKDLFNKNLIKNFEKDPKISNLHKIIIELELILIELIFLDKIIWKKKKNMELLLNVSSIQNFLQIYLF